MSSSGYETVIGIEVHVQLDTNSKMFCSCKNEYGSGDNTNICPICTGMPGALPSLNKKAIEYAVKTGLALNCEINSSSVFARKNYFYPDMPRGYQISQYAKPICGVGHIQIRKKTGDKKTIGITRAHLEEDAGKSIHFAEHSLINLNRASTPLLEIVSEPDLSSPSEAAEYVRQIRSIVKYLEVCDGNLEEGSLRADCNVSIRPKGQKELGTKVELKNLNSFRFIEKALEYEVARQTDMHIAGEADKIIQETRLYDSDKNRTYSMRAKETDKDYRYFTEPDLLKCIVPSKLLNSLKENPSLLASDYESVFIEKYKVREEEAKQLSAEKSIALFYTEVCEFNADTDLAAKWIIRELTAALKELKVEVTELKFGAREFAELMQLISDKTVSAKIASELFGIMIEEGGKPKKIVEDRSMVQISDESMVEQFVDKIIKDNPSQVEEYQSGKQKVFGFFVGRIMRESKGKANPDVVSKLLKEKLK